MKFTFELTPEEFKELVGTSTVEQFFKEAAKQYVDALTAESMSAWPKTMTEFFEQFQTFSSSAHSQSKQQ